MARPMNNPNGFVELLDGNLISMEAKGTAHRSATTRTRRVLEEKLGKRVLVRVQDPVQLDNDSEPELDLAISTRFFCPRNSLVS